MADTSHPLVQKLWSFCDTLRDDGVSYGDYVEQLTYLLFLKMADENSKRSVNPIKSEIPKGYDWQSLLGKSGAELEDHYFSLLRRLSEEPGMLGEIFTKSQNKIQDPAKLYRLVHLIDEETWARLGADVKGDIYEGLLQKNAEDTKSGAGQYFTPRALIRAMVDCVRPQPMKTIADPSCGTGGFFLAAYDFITHPERSGKRLDRDELEFLKKKTFRGWEIVANTARLCLMNLYLHGIGDLYAKDTPIDRADSLLGLPGQYFDYVLANPPFGKKSSFQISNDGDGEKDKKTQAYERQDFWVSSSNKQLNFVQHIRSILRPDGGVAAVVVPDNVLFEGGAGETVRKKLLENTDLHTILRLPTGIFYAQGVKANVLFFEARPASKHAQTKEVWYYDYRTNIHHTLKKNVLRYEDLEDFIRCYHPANRSQRTEIWSESNPEGRWRKYTYDEIIARDKTSLDIFWLKDDSLADLDNLPDPDVLAAEIVDSVSAGLERFQEVAGLVSEE